MQNFTLHSFSAVQALSKHNEILKIIIIINDVIIIWVFVNFSNGTQSVEKLLNTKFFVVFCLYMLFFFYFHVIYDIFMNPPTGNGTRDQSVVLKNVYIYILGMS